MESSSSRSDGVKKKKAELKAKIASLQAQLAEIPDDQICTIDIPQSPKRKEPEPTLLVPATPSPKKKRRIEQQKIRHSQPRIAQSSSQKRRAAVSSTSSVSQAPSQPNKVVASQFLNKLAEVKTRSSDSPAPEAVVRTAAFSDKPMPAAKSENDTTMHASAGLKRDDRLALVEDIESGPYEFTAPSDDLDFLQLEPHSGIRLSKRILPHADLQDYMRARYYLSPSRLYSVIRLRPDKQGYDVPLPGDWVTIAVVAERGPVKFTRPPVTLDPEENESNKPWKKEKKEEARTTTPAGKKYVNFKLIDFGARSKSSADGAQSVIRGDAFLTLLLFEADGLDLITGDNRQRTQKVYKGGSRGAFESMSKVKEGDVIALLNPKILKPYQRSNDAPHPVNNILALTPESAGSIEIIGRSRDLGMCTVTKRDGKPCGSWCDKRISEVCDYHLQHAVQQRRAGRAEFSIGTSGMSTTAVHKKKNNYDPARKWGLIPEETSSGSTYVVSGHVVNGSNADPRMMYVGEQIGREGQAKAQRKSGANADQALKALLERDREGMRAVMLAREANGVSDSVSTGKKGKLKGNKEESCPASIPCLQGSGKNGYKAEIIKELGFDPTFKPGRTKKADNVDVQQKLETLENLRKSRKEITLGSRPGLKIRSGVVLPVNNVAGQQTGKQTSECDDELGMVDLDDF